MITVRNTTEGLIPSLEIKGNTVQNPSNLSDIKSVGIDKGDDTYEVSILSSNGLEKSNPEYKEDKCTIKLPCQLEKVGEVSDRLYFDKVENAWCIEKKVIPKVEDGIIVNKQVSPQKIVLPLDTQIQLNQFVDTTHVWLECGEVNGTIKATFSKSMVSTVQTNSNKINILSDRVASIEGLKESQDMAYTTDKGYLVCKETKNGTVKDLKIVGNTMLQVYPQLPIGDGYHFTPSSKGANITRDGQYIRIETDGTNYTDCAIWASRNVHIKPSTLYTFVIKIAENTLTGNAHMNSEYANRSMLDDQEARKFVINKGYTGTKVILATTKDSAWFEDASIDIKVLLRTQLVPNTSGVLKYSVNMFEGNITDNLPNSYIEGIASVGNEADKIEVSSVKSDANLFDVEDFVIGSNSLYAYAKVQNESEDICISLIDKDSSIDINGIFIGLSGNGKDANEDVYWNLENGTIVRAELSRRYNYVSFFPNNKETLDKILKRFDIMVNKGTQPIPYQPCKQDKKPILFKDADGAWKPVKELRGLDTVCDTIELHTDGKYYYHQRTVSKTLTGGEGEDWRRLDNVDTSNTERYALYVDDVCIDGKLMSNRFKYIHRGGDDKSTCIYIHNIDKRIDIRMLKTDNFWTDLVTLKEWLKVNNLIIIYQLAEEKVFEVNPLFLEAFEGETMISCSSRAINPGLELKISSYLPNIVKLNEKRISKLESDFYQYTVVQNRLALTSRYNADRVDFKVDNTIGNPLRSSKALDHDLFNLMKVNIEVGKENYNRVEMEEKMDFYVNEGIIDWDMWDELFEAMELQHNPPVDLTPIEPMTVEEKEDEKPKKSRRGRKKKVVEEI